MKKAIFLVACLTPLTSGCKTADFNWSRKLPWAEDRKVQETRFQQPGRMAVVWTDAAYTEPNRPPARGFGGRIYFYNAQNQAIPVEGQLTVYAYDDSRKDKTAQVPDRKFVFSAEQFSKHFSETDLGASYSVWIPWGEVGGPQVELSLLPVFRSAAGHVVIGQQTMNVLPGPKTPPSSSKSHQITPSQPGPPISAVRPVAYQQSVDPQLEQVPNKSSEEAVLDAAPRLRTATISVPPSTTRQLALPMYPSSAAWQNDEAARANAGLLMAAPTTAAYAPAVPRTLPTQAYGPETTGTHSRTVGAPPWTPPDPRLTRFVRPRSQVPEGPHAQPDHARAPWPQYPEGSPSAHPRSPETGPMYESEAGLRAAGRFDR